MRSAIVVILFTAVASVAQVSRPVSASAPSMRGYPDAQAATEQAAERKAQAIPQPDRIRQYMERMAQQPHHAGSPMSASVAQYALGLFKSFGLDAHIEEFEALIPYPTTRVVE